MYFFFHLLTGLILGLLIGDLLQDRRWVLPCAIGAILPDLIDKPLGMVVLATSIGDGRIFGHTVLAAIALGIIGLLILKYGKTPVVAGLAVGIISHQILDTMWDQPRNWLYPAYGAFFQYDPSNDIISLLWRELQNPLEIFLFVSLCAGMGVYLYRDRIGAALSHYKAWVQGILAFGALGLCILSGIIIGISRGKHSLPYLAWSGPEEFLIGGIVTALAAFLLWRWSRKMRDTDTAG